MTRRMPGGARRIARAAAFAFSAFASVLPLAAAGASTAPAQTSAEYRLSWGLAASKADRAYREGATGRGVLVAMIDTGVDPAARALFANLEAVDMIPGRKDSDAGSGHGRQTAALLAARLDGVGTLGIAYDATLLSIRADRDGSCRADCRFDGEVLAAAIDYALDHGARVIGMPVAASKPLPAIEAALARAAARGVVIVAAAGNSGDKTPAFPARYAVDPRYAGAMLVAGAADSYGWLARFSNRPGGAAQRYIAAPGVRLPVDCDGTSCVLKSGTSYSVSYVAGAVALLLSRRPDLSPAEAAEALLASAQPMAGAGRGRLDIGKALARAERAAGDGVATAAAN